MKKIIVTVLMTILVLLGVEATVHYCLGLGETPTYIEDPQFEYIYSPNQAVHRFGNLILTNEYSMRSLPLKNNEYRILMFGDSVLNGGNLTDHSQLATTLLENHFQKEVNQSIRILNISAGGWGPDNAYAYLTKYGNFDANEIILVFSSHDANDNMKHEKIVDLHKSYPSTQPYTAITDGFFRYFVPRMQKLFSYNNKEEFPKINKIELGEKFNTGWSDFVDYAKLYHIRLSVILHPNREEVINRQYNENGMEIINFLKRNNIFCHQEIENITLQYYRDGIHYNVDGQRFLYSEAIPIIERSGLTRLNN